MEPRTQHRAASGARGRSIPPHQTRTPARAMIHSRHRTVLRCSDGCSRMFAFLLRIRSDHTRSHLRAPASSFRSDDAGRRSAPPRPSLAPPARHSFSCCELNSSSRRSIVAHSSEHSSTSHLAPCARDAASSQRPIHLPRRASSNPARSTFRWAADRPSIIRAKESRLHWLQTMK